MGLRVVGALRRESFEARYTSSKRGAQWRCDLHCWFVSLRRMSVGKWLSKMKEVGNLKGPLDWLRICADGNLFVTIFEKGPTGNLVGEDEFGNKYYEDESTHYNRKRWVVYKDMTNYNPSIVPPEWHGWLNYINDYAPTQHDFKRPIYAIEASVTKTGSTDYYQPKGAWVNPDKRNWLKYEAWQPPRQ